MALSRCRRKVAGGDEQEDEAGVEAEREETHVEQRRRSAAACSVRGEQSREEEVGDEHGYVGQRQLVEIVQSITAGPHLADCSDTGAEHNYIPLRPDRP